ncbi:MAG: SDR family oxidoreductase [Anaerolineales bacterium]
MKSPLILVTGASGYIASRLIPRLLEGGYRVRALARQPEQLVTRSWGKKVELLEGDVIDPASLQTALDGVQTAYYLIHHMASGRGYTRLEIEGARNFASAAERAGLEHIIYLGGLADPNAKNLAPHMRSRIETGNALRQGRVPVTEFRAGVIVGPGSISFEMVRFLTECFPVLIGPNWLRNKVQPIAARNVIDYLVAALEHPQARGGVYGIGGPDVMLYSDTMLRYASLRGLRRLFFTLPGIPVWFMARMVDWLTPVPASIARPLIEGLQSDSIVLDDSAHRFFSGIMLVPYPQAVTESLADLTPKKVERVWEGIDHAELTLKHEGFFIDFRQIQIDATIASIYRAITSLGGPNGWPFANWLWNLRGRLDGLVGGPGLRGYSPLTPYPSLTWKRDEVKEGDIIDYYRVESLEENHRMRLYSELRAPGLGWMEWTVEPAPSSGSVLTQTAFFAPRGLPGFLYWFLLSPLHCIVFRGLIRAIAQRSKSI